MPFSLDSSGRPIADVVLKVLNTSSDWGCGRRAQQDCEPAVCTIQADGGFGAVCLALAFDDAWSAALRRTSRSS